MTLSGSNTVGVFSVNADVLFTVENLTIANGHAVNGGGIDNNGGTVSITNTTFADNSATAGGGINNGGGSVTITSSTFTGNSAGNGGGGINNGYGGTLAVTNSTFTGNTGPADYPAGGAALANAGTATVTNSTVAGNGGSAAISNFSRGPFPDRALTVTNTILAANTPENCLEVRVGIQVHAGFDGGHNLDDGTSCGFTNGSLSNTDPRLDPAGLQNNGGPTRTIALLADSPAIDAGDETVCAAAPVSGLDQRGFGRPGTGYASCSIGAFEYNGSDPPLTSCAGDCDGNGSVAVDELVMLVNIALGEAQGSRCPHGLPSGATVAIAVILHGVNNALTGCGHG